MENKLEHEYILILLAVVIGIVVGLLSIIYAGMINWLSSHLYQNYIKFHQEHRFILLISPAIGGLIVGLLIRYGSITAKGHGIPAILSTIESKKTSLSTRDLLVEGFASAVTIGTGGSAGRIGPVVEIGAGIGDLIGHRFKFPLDLYRTVLGCGAAAGISAIFNAPLGGIMFVIEILYKRLEITRLSMIVISSISADAFVRGIVGYQPIFQLPEFKVNGSWEYLLYILLGLFLGIAAYFFINLLYKTTGFFDQLDNVPFYIKPFFGGLFTGVIAYNIPEIMGTGIPAIYNALQGKYLIGLLILITIFKIFATSITLGSGGSGGIFAPGLLIGTTAGISFGQILLHFFPALSISTSSYGLVGMAGFISGITQAPLTGVLIIFELTRNYSLIIPLLLVSVISSSFARRLNPESIYSPKLFLKLISKD